jgi:hypothetical protein
MHDGILDDYRDRVIRCHDHFVVDGQGCKLDAVCGKETGNVVCSDFAVTNVLDVGEEVHDRHRNLCYGEDCGKKMYSVETVCIWGAGFQFDKYDTEVRFYKIQVIFDIDAMDKCKSALFLWKRRWWDRVIGIIGIRVNFLQSRAQQLRLRQLQLQQLGSQCFAANGWGYPMISVYPE